MPKGGQAEKAGVKAGMEVVGVDGKDVANWFRVPHGTTRLAAGRNPRKAGDKVDDLLQPGRQEARRHARTGDDGVRGPVRRRRSRPGEPAAALPDRPDRGRAAAERPERPGQGRLQTGGIYVSKDYGESLEPHQQPQPAAVLLLQHPCRSEQRQAHLRPWRYARCGRAPTAASSSPRPTPAASTRTTTPCGSTRRTAGTCSSAATAASMSPTTAARRGTT